MCAGQIVPMFFVRVHMAHRLLVEVRWSEDGVGRIVLCACARVCTRKSPQLKKKRHQQRRDSGALPPLVIRQRRSHTRVVT
jgi:hypothetical protein